MNNDGLWSHGVVAKIRDKNIKKSTIRDRTWMSSKRIRI